MLVEFYYVERDKFVQVESSHYDFANLVCHQTARHHCSCAVNKRWIKSVDIETNVDGPSQFLYEVDNIWCVQDSYILRLNGFSLGIVNVADANIGKLVEG